jgi:hypothetical protein
MYLEDYCSEYVRKIYGIAGCFNGEYVDKYLYSLDDEDNINQISNKLRDIKPSNKELVIDSGFVCEFKYKDCDGYVVVQSLYDNKERSISDVLRLLADYSDELKENGMEEVMIIDSYSEFGNTLHSFDICFILGKDE